MIAGLPPAANVSNPVDMLASASPETYADCLKILLGEENVDGVLVILPPPPMYRAEEVARKLIDVLESSGDPLGSIKKPVVVALLGSTLIEEALSTFQHASVPTYPFPERAASALGALVKRATYLDDGPGAEDLAVHGQRSTAGLSAEELLAAYGIPTAPIRLARTVEEAQSIAQELGYPLVMKNELNAEAFTIGRDVFFNTGRYKPSSIEGKKLLAHELVHVVHQSRGNTTINCWGHKDHIKITETAAKGIITDGFFMFHLLGQVNTMDYMERRLVKVAIPAAKKEIFGTIYSEGAEHGEGGEYKDTSENTAAKKNVDLQNLRFNKALSFHQSSILLIKKGVPVHKVGEVSEKLFVSLGDACHIAQDRGSHREGTKGMGHDDQREKEEWWRADNPRDNGPGYEKAIENTKQLLTQWVTKRREIDKE